MLILGCLEWCKRNDDFITFASETQKVIIELKRIKI